MKKAIILSMMLALVLTGCGVKGSTAAKVLKPEEAKTKITEFINNTLLAGAGYQATVNSISEENGLYKVAISVNNQNIDAYLTKDVTLFFPQAIKVVTASTTANSGSEEAQAPVTQEVNKKVAKPTVELFVMSQCPYGTEIEKGILPVIDTLSKKIDFKVKFCDYAMHGQGELNEEMSQYCIQKNEPQNLVPYLKCYLASNGSPSDAAKCVQATKINQAKLKSCVATTDKSFKVTAGFNDKSTWTKDREGKPAFPVFNVFKEDNEKYGVGGSPTLVINGETINANRTPASLLKTICSGFDKQPEECKASLSAEKQAPGFGYKAAAAGSDSASCATPAQQ